MHQVHIVEQRGASRRAGAAGRDGQVLGLALLDVGFWQAHAGRSHATQEAKGWLFAQAVAVSKVVRVDLSLTQLELRRAVVEDERT